MAENSMRQLVVVGLVAAAMVAFAGLGLLLLLVALVISASERGNYPAASGNYPNAYSGYPAGHDSYPDGYAQPITSSPADQWLNGNEFSGRMSSGTIDSSGQGNDVISVDGEVLNLP